MNMEELARLAGVSKGAVSLALNGKPGVGQETRERILRLARESGYTGHSKGKGKTAAAEANATTLRFLVFTNAGLVHEEYYQQPFFRELIHHIEERCRMGGYRLMFSAIEEKHYEQGIRTIMEEPTSGVILLGTSLESSRIADIADKLPGLIVLDTCFDALPVHFVEINNYMGAYQAGTYLTGHGHRRIGYIASEERIHNFEERQRGFMAAMAEAQVEIPRSSLLAVPPTLFSSQGPLRDKLQHLKDSGQPFPTAFFCECDYIAISTIKALGELGFSIPEDVSVIGFDNINESLIVTPELTTVHVEKERMAAWAVDLFTSSLGVPPVVSTKIKVDTLFIARSSCRRLEPVTDL
ncbi:LacI family DNA-binding transcriptional regulator [Paenibacillus tritici]|uniref:LacI family DNA-binding transcriptional regulator n=1 Tax=Paenibacillus tritici TaxID=1873425 RepID=A0ABX2DMM1_9BACL|nr:LacI family DNA-binding transcriptional regulator [Paenibacillus tritici]NQX45482.1 LacI family DNA-binding transcriptional regulator [Paenibacillus tritici]